MQVCFENFSFVEELEELDRVCLVRLLFVQRDVVTFLEVDVLGVVRCWRNCDVSVSDTLMIPK